MYSLEKILLPVDFSDRAKGAAHYAVALATRAHSELELIHVVEPPYVLGMAEGSGSVFTENRLAQALEQWRAITNNGKSSCTGANPVSGERECL